MHPDLCNTETNISVCDYQPIAQQVTNPASTHACKEGAGADQGLLTATSCSQGAASPTNTATPSGTACKTQARENDEGLREGWKHNAILTAPPARCLSLKWCSGEIWQAAGTRQLSETHEIPQPRQSTRVGNSDACEKCQLPRARVTPLKSSILYLEHGTSLHEKAVVWVHSKSATGLWGAALTQLSFPDISPTRGLLISQGNFLQNILTKGKFLDLQAASEVLCVSCYKYHISKIK